MAQSFDVDMYLRASWYDEREAHNFSEPKELSKVEQLRAMWLPDLYFGNARKAIYHKVTTPNLGGFVYNDGTVSLSRRSVLL